jgi:hypothetical protein
LEPRFEKILLRGYRFYRIASVEQPSFWDKNFGFVVTDRLCSQEARFLEYFKFWNK